MGRQTGQTSRQMQEAPHGATFIWCNDQLSYPRSLARHLGRLDLQIVGLSTLQDRGRRLSGLLHVVLDHASCLSQEQAETWRIVRLYCAARRNPQ